MKHLLVIILFVFVLAGYGQGSASLKVVIKKFDNDQGRVMAGLYNSSKTWLEDEFLGADTSIYNTDEVVIYFSGVPAGEYAVSVYHDVNANRELDTNFMGIPTEDYAFSNNATGNFGPAKYEDAAFEVSGVEIVQTIKLN